MRGSPGSVLGGAVLSALVLGSIGCQGELQFAVAPAWPGYSYPSRWVTVDGVRLHYVEVGTGNPIVLVHGQPTWSYQWRSVVPHLAHQGRVIALDLAGFGKSDRPDLEYSLKDHAGFFAGFIEALALDDITFVAQDWGSFLTFDYAAAHPDRVRALAFFEAILPPWLQEPDPAGPYADSASVAMEILRIAMDADSSGRGRQLIDEENVFIERWLPLNVLRTLSEPEMDAYRLPFPEGSNRQPMIQLPREILRADPRDFNGYTEWLTAAPVPKLMLVGSPGFLARSAHRAWALANLPELTVVDLGEGLHFLAEDHGEGMGRAIAAWVQRLRTTEGTTAVGAGLGGRSEEGFLTADDGVRLYYRTVGTGEPTLVVPLAVYLSPLLDGLARGRRIVYFDPRGRGRSHASPLSWLSLAREIADIEVVRRAFGLETFALLGWSGFGMQSAAYALDHPERVSRLVQVSPVPPRQSMMAELGGDARASRTDTAAVRRLREEEAAGAYRHRPEAFCRDNNALTLPGNFADPAKWMAVPDVCAFENEWPVNLWPYFGALLASFGDYDWTARLAELEMPRLVIHGTEDGIPVAGGRAWVAGSERARIVELTSSGHFPFIERAPSFFAAVDAFLGGEWPTEARSVPGR